MAMLAQLLQVFTGFIAPLIIYFVKRDSRFVAFHALQALLWQITYFVLFFGCFVAVFVTMFATIPWNPPPHPPGTPPPGPPPALFVLFPLLWLLAFGGFVLNLVIGIVYCIKANNGEWAAYPVIGRLARRIVGA
jgi:uncharacterized membrane protein